jgi:hypothetical protein
MEHSATTRYASNALIDVNVLLLQLFAIGLAENASAGYVMYGSYKENFGQSAFSVAYVAGAYRKSSMAEYRESNILYGNWKCSL